MGRTMESHSAKIRGGDIMDFLQIRDDRPLSEWKQKCVARLHEIMVPVDTYTLLDLPHYETLTEVVNAADAMRVEWLINHKDGVWVDDDCFLKERWEPAERGIVYLPHNETPGENDAPDIFLIYVNHDPDWIRRNMSAKARAKWIEKNVMEEYRKSFYGFPLEMTRRWLGFGYIPGDKYIHTYQTMNAEIDRRRKETMVEQQQQQQATRRHINDVVNEVIVKFDTATHDVKTSIMGLRDLINKLFEENKKLIDEIEGIKKALPAKN